jgi:hypothetical protein
MTGSATRWPIAIVALLGLTVVANAYLWYRASEPTPLESDYYRRAVDWDSTMAQATRNQALGWRLTGDLGGDGRLVARVTGRDGRPIVGASVRVSGFPIAHADGVLQAVLAPSGDRYAGLVPLPRRGLYELRFEVIAGGDRFTAALRGTPGAAFEPKP